MGSSKKKTSSTTKNLLPEYINQGSKKAVGMASNIADRQYEAFGGQRIADLSQNEAMGMGMARSNIGAYDSDFNAARGSLESIGSITDPGALQGYMNPYMEMVLAPEQR